MLDTTLSLRPEPRSEDVDALELFERRLEPLLASLEELPWELDVEVRREPPARVFRAASRGELWVPVTIGDRTLQVGLRWPAEAPSAPVVVAMAQTSLRAIAGATEAELRAIKAQRRAARAERRVTSRSTELQALRTDLTRLEVVAQTERSAVSVAETRLGVPLDVASALLSAVAHDIRSPLTSLVCNLRALEEDIASRRDTAGTIADTQLACQMIDEVLGSVRAISGLDARPTLVRVDAAVDAALRLVRWHVSRSGATVAVRGDASASAWSTAAVISRVVLTLVARAADVSPRGSKVVVTTSKEAGAVVVRVTDEGAPLPEDAVEATFAPFPATPRRGLDLSLAAARSLARSTGGDLVAVPTPPGERGATFELRLSSEVRTA